MMKLRYILSAIIAAFGVSYFNELGNIVSVSSGLLFVFTVIAILLGILLYGQVLEMKENFSKEPIALCVFFQKIQNSIYHGSDIRFLGLFWMGLLLGYLPAYIALFPGTFGYDGPVQIAQYFGDMDLTSHHPLAHTYFMGFFFSLGNILFENYEIGFAMYTAVQGIIVTGAVSYSLLFGKRHNVPFVWMIVGALYLLANPFTQMIMFSSTKDVLFAAFLLMFGTEFAYMVVDESNHMIKLTIFGILMCLFRNQGIYIAIAILIIVGIWRGGKKELYISLGVIVGLSYFFFWSTTSLLHIPAGDKREMLCVPMQQVAYVACEYGSEITDKQWSLVEEVMSVDGIVAYNPSTADAVKSYFNTNELTDNIGEHVKNYIELGVENPEMYKQAWEWMVEPYWNSEANPYKGLALQYTFDEVNRWDIKHAGLFNSHYHRLLAATQDYELVIWERPELCLWIMIAIVAVAIAKRNSKTFVILLPFALYFGTVLLGPVALVRYLYPITIATPLLLSMLFVKETN